MKKILLVLTTAMLSLSFVACGGTTSNVATDEPSAVASESPTETVEATETTSESVTPETSEEAKADTDTATSDGKTVSITHALGTVDVPVNPKKIVSFDLSILDSIDRLNIEGLEFSIPKSNLPVYLAKFNESTVVDAGDLKEPNLEVINEFKPDVIFIAGRQEEYYDRLSEIAPTVYTDIDGAKYMEDFEKNMHVLGQIFEKEDVITEEISSIKASIDAVAKKAEASNKKALVLLTNDGTLSAYGSGSRFGMIHDVLKVPAADEQIEVSTHGNDVDFEYVSKVNPDIIYVVDRSKAIGVESTNNVLDNELIMQTTAGKNGKIIELTPDVWYLTGAGLQSIPIMIEEVSTGLD